MTIVLIAIAGFSIFDGISTVGRIHPGVSVEGIDVGGLTVEEASDLLEQELSPRLEDGYVVAFSSVEEMNAYDPATADFSVPEGSVPTKWKITSSDLGASIDGDVLARSAYDATRGHHGIRHRLEAWTDGIDVEAYVSCDLGAFNNCINSMDAVMGTPMENADLLMVDGTMTITPSRTGNLIDRREFLTSVSRGLLDGEGTFVPTLHEVEPLISDVNARATAIMVQKAITDPVTLSYKDSTWTMDTASLGNCVGTRVAKGNNDPHLVAFIDGDKTKGVIEGIIGDAKATGTQDAYIDVSEGVPIIIPGVSGVGPDLKQASSELENIVFGGQQDRAITMVETTVEPDFTTADAESMGVTELISSYSMDASSAYAAKQHNMALACETLSYVVIAPGETWSWNDYVGDTTVDKGYEEGHTVSGGVIESSIGGGICQVATTIFNAVYEAGLQIDERHNHSMYFSDYPTGRDATISYGTYDLKWTNNSGHYIIMQMIDDGSTITCNLYGTDPGFTVETDTGDWVEGAAYSTKVVEDPAYPTGYEAIEQGGSNGKSITVTRHVYKDGVEVSTDVFDSYYSPTTEVKIVGTGTAEAAATSQATGAAA